MSRTRVIQHIVKKKFIEKLFYVRSTGRKIIKTIFRELRPQDGNFKYLSLGLGVIALGVVSTLIFSTHTVYAADIVSGLPRTVVNAFTNYDNNTGGATSGCYVTPPQEYDLQAWLWQTDITNANSATLNGSGSASLNLSSRYLACYKIVQGNVHYSQDALVTSGGLSAINEQIQSSGYILSPNVGTVSFSRPNPQVTFNINNSTRLWSSNDVPLTYKDHGATGPVTVSLTLKIKAINDFNGALRCVSDGGAPSQVSGFHGYPPTPTSFAWCNSGDARPLTMTFQPPASSNVNLTGNIKKNGANANNVKVQACNCGGLCQRNDPSAEAGPGKGIGWDTTGPGGNFTLTVQSGNNTCISVVSPPSGYTATLNPGVSANGGTILGGEYVIKPVRSSSSGGWDFSYTSCVGSGCGGTIGPNSIAGNCSQSTSAVYGDFYTTSQPPSPSDVVTFKDNEGTATANANVSPDTSTESDTFAGSYPVSTAAPGTVSNPQPKTPGVYTYTTIVYDGQTPVYGQIPFNPYVDDGTGNDLTYTGIVGWDNNYTVSTYQENFTHWTFTLGLPSSSVVQFSLDPVNISDSYGSSSVFSPQSECDPNPPSISSGGFSCSARNVSYSASDPDAAFSSGDITYTVDGGGAQTSNSSPIDMSSYDQLLDHTVVITVQDVNIFGAPANGAGWEAVNGPTSVTIDYPPCYQATCGSASVPGVVQVNSQFSVTITLGFIQLNGAGPPPPSAMGGTLSDNFLSQTGSINNTYQLVSVFTAPATGGDETITWTYNDPGGVGLPISCNTDVVIADEPYLRSYGGDVTDGQGFANSTTGTCTNKPSASILAWNGGPLGAYTGAGVQFAALAMSALSTGGIRGFASSDGAKAGVPAGLSFGNTTANPAADNYGGGYQGYTPCIPDYYDAAVSSNTTVHNFIGNIIINNGILPGGTSIENVSSPTVVKVKGNVTITNSGPSINNTGPWVNFTTVSIPQLPPSPYESLQATAPSSWTTAGTASASGNNVQLTTPAFNEAGSAFTTQRFNTQNQGAGNFSVSFNANLGGGGPGGADGLTMVLDGAASPGSSPLGTGGCGEGVDFSSGKAVAVSLDTYQNWPGVGGTDPSNNFVGIATGFTPGDPGNGVSGANCHLNYVTTNPRIGALRNDNSIVSTPINVSYDSAARVLYVYMNGDLVLSYPITLAGQVLVGFTGSTGGAVDWHSVSDVQISQNVLVTPLAPPPGTKQVVNPDSLAIPSLYLVAEGNIYIDPSVKSLDGIYVAQHNGTNGGSIYTCNNANYNGTGQPLIAAGNTGYYAACSGNQLIVNGAFVANKVVLGRAYSSADTGAQGDTAASPGTGWNNAAEVFNYTPADWLENPFSETTNTYDAITSLPPVL